MQRLAKVESGVVVDIIVGDKFPGHVPVGAEVQRGWVKTATGFEAPAKVEPVDDRTLDEQRADAIAEVNAAHADAISRLAKRASLDERSTWPRKAAAANAHANGTASEADAAALEDEAKAAGVSVDALVATIRENDAKYTRGVGTASGLRSAAAKSLTAAKRSKSVAGVVVAAVASLNDIGTEAQP